MARHKHSRMWAWGVIVILGAAMVLLLVVAPSLRSPRAKLATARCNDYIATLRATGEPVTLAEIEATRPAIPPNENGAAFLESLSKELEPLGHMEAKNVLFFDESLLDLDLLAGIPSHAVEPSQAFLQAHREVVVKLLHLAEFDIGRLAIPYDRVDLLEMTMPTLQEWRVAPRMLRLESTVALLEGDVSRAVDALAPLMHVGATLDNEANLISRLVQRQCDDYALDTLELLLSSVELNEGQLASLATLVQNRLRQPSLERCFIFERALFLERCDGMAAGRYPLPVDIEAGEDPDKVPEVLRHVSVADIRENALIGMQLYTKLVRAAHDPALLLRTARQLDQQMEAKAPTWRDTRNRAIVSRMMLTVSRAVAHHPRLLAKLRCARTALAVEAFRLEHGDFPTTLQTLVPEYLDIVPTDPFTGDPLRYKKVDEGIIIYSVGDNFEDDGGNLTRTEEAKRSPDVGFRLFTDRSVRILDDEE